MALRLPDHWVWDSWTAEEGERKHLFFLRASRALLDPELRHRRASIGHAVSADWRSWTLLPDALVPAEPDAWDDLATWTGSVVRDGEGWRMFYTGVGRADHGLVQRIGSAVSDDLVTWHRDRAMPVLEADPRWYERLDPGSWTDEAWRDPHVFRDPGGDGWHMLVTARAKLGPADGRGVIGHARSPDLRHWEAGPPLSAPAGFGHLEVPQVRRVCGRTVLVFSCRPREMAPEHPLARADPPPGVWTAPAAGPTGPFDIAGARPLRAGSLYAGRLIVEPDGGPALLGFRDMEDGRFVGEIADPVPVFLDGDLLTTGR
ncbi:hypothetical protein ACFFMN_34455 [Planobispora siamensis]|uniref:Glycosyl hydrolase family 32 N-terminal domain-containing protein n=1 Tax=Planobispora siamensis TaxID=936338 RepID=A0A8J3SFB5_9ACTN|nr:hypothetical protein [Planobispora siamensis]GIH91842.1 hypothetical protein Psi01_24720 [Planobispora siamensis]